MTVMINRLNFIEYSYQKQQIRMNEPAKLTTVKSSQSLESRFVVQKTSHQLCFMVACNCLYLFTSSILTIRLQLERKNYSYHYSEYLSLINQKNGCILQTYKSEQLRFFQNITYNIMIITIILYIVDWLVLLANDVSILPTHSLYLIFLTFILWKRKQPESYSNSVKELTKIYEQRNISLPQKIRECQICRKAKPERYYHCRHCDRCVYRLDHHCHFVGNCIGQYNSKVYVHLLANTLIHSLGILIVTIKHYQNLLTFSSRQALFTLTLLPTLFGIYETQRLLRAFWTTVHRNQTLIQSYKQVRGQKLSNLASLQAYFGKDKFWWFFPTFQKNDNCDLFEKTYQIEHESQIKEYKYADEYLYGPDQEDDQFQEKKE